MLLAKLGEILGSFCSTLNVEVCLVADLLWIEASNTLSEDLPVDKEELETTSQSISAIPVSHGTLK